MGDRRVRQSNNFRTFRTSWSLRLRITLLSTWVISTTGTVEYGNHFAKGFGSPLRRLCGTMFTPSSIDVGTWAKEPTSQLAPSLAPSSSRRNWLGKRHNVCTISFTKTTSTTTTTTTTTTETTTTTTTNTGRRNWLGKRHN